MGQRTLEDLLQLLSNKRSPKRRTGAKGLRRLGNPAAGPALLEALQKEVGDPRTWETQYHMIMALGESDYRPALPFLRELAARPLRHPHDPTMPYVALGDAIVRLARAHDQDPTPVLELLGENEWLAAGAVRAVAMLKLKLAPDAVDQILEHASRPGNDQVRFWAAAAAAGWRGPRVEAFLRACQASTSADTRKAAEAAARGEYLSWSPL